MNGVFFNYHKGGMQGGTLLRLSARKGTIHKGSNTIKNVSFPPESSF